MDTPKQHSDAPDALIRGKERHPVKIKSVGPSVLLCQCGDSTHRPMLTLQMPRIAWTGGTVASRETYQSDDLYRAIVNHLFQEQVIIFRDYWKELPNLDTCRIFWGRAKGDAWATIRDYFDLP